MIESTYARRWSELSTGKQALLDKRLYQLSVETEPDTPQETDGVIQLVQTVHYGTCRPAITPVSREAYRRKLSELAEADR